jgi:multicomponent Na+:H+ antiporter subunit D
MMEHLTAWIPMVLFIGALVAPLCRRGARIWPYSVAVLATGTAFAASLTGLWQTVRQGEPVHYFFGGWAPPVGIELILDPLSAFFCALVTGAGLFALWHGRTLVEEETPGKSVPFYSAVLLLLGGFCGMLLTGDMFNLYVFLEISSLATYALLSIGDRRAPVAGFRYLILGTVGASFYLLGVGFLFMVTGSLNMADVAAILPELGHSPVTLAGLVLIVLGIGLKMALFPMHGWLPDAYSYASSTSTALVGAVGTKVAAYVLIRTLYFIEQPFFVSEVIPLSTILAYLGAAGVVWGAAMAMAQKELKRMLAFSSVGHVGYIALGIGLASPLGFVAAVLHCLNHAIMKLCLFQINGTLYSKLGHTTIARFDNTLAARMPWTMLALAITALSMIGLPPTAGFFSKWYLVLGALEQGAWLLVVAIVMSSLFAVVYFFRLLEKIYLRTPGEKGPVEVEQAPVARDEARFSMLAPVLILSVSLLVLGLGNFLVVRYLIVPMFPAGWSLEGF